MAAATIELSYIASHYSISESTLSTLTQAPTVELVNQLLESIVTKAREFDDLKSDKLRLDVELENAVRSSDSKIKVLKNSVQKGHTEVEDLRKKQHELGNTVWLLSLDLSDAFRKCSVCSRIRNRHAQVILHDKRVGSEHPKVSYLVTRSVEPRYLGSVGIKVGCL